MIKGAQVAVRTISEGDIDHLYRLSMDYADAGEFMPVSLVSKSKFRQEFDRSGYWDDTCGKLVIEHNDGELVGEIGCFKGAHYLDGRELYYRIYSSHRRKGYAKDALGCFVDFYFKSTNFNRLQAVTINGNGISANMLKKCGFQFEGKLRQARWFKGRLVDLNMYSCLRSEWAA